MKQKDIILLMVVGFVSVVFSLLISNWLFSSPARRQQTVEIVDPISNEFTQPDSKYFNANSINPTKIIQIGDNPNPQPFNGQ